MIFYRQIITLSTLTLCGLLCFSLPVLAQEQTKQLDTVKKQIAQQKSEIVKVNKKREALNKQLKRDDYAIAKVAKAINSTNKVRKQTQVKLAKLVKQQRILNLAKAKQEKVLAIQLRSSYISGQHDYMKMLLNQEETSDVQKNITYYQYLNNARLVEIDKFQETLTKLDDIAVAHEQQVQKLTSLQTKQQEQKAALEQNKKRRTKTLQSLQKELLSTQQQLAKLKEEEASLKQALSQLASLSQKTINLDGLSKLRGKLKWPIKGRLRHSFGSRKQGYLKWKGVLISAPVGRAVNTIHDGKVLFADWLKGYGLVTVVDHGKGYMSLYGHNQALLKNVGDKVKAGEPIALAGQSGGQSQSGLYFEVRYRGKAVNPKAWCK
ncbi:murein hydrolase activator EnvC family protein [Thalassotalea atypica]|uniref:murein hydrolase activator EnvC family protein n=1 Tax=Thalassotalea atypica TaxID=2054316 RepID=UPI002572B12A|nr:peptidoglycan DD-metalloendopeptidase family protein [Thalassotalea atypica]